MRKTSRRKTILYKVVEKGTRHGSNWALFKAGASPQDRRHYDAVNAWRRKNKAWFPRYLKGHVIEKAPGSIGLLTFRTLGDAREFIGQECRYVQMKIIKVRGKISTKQNVLILAGVGYFPKYLANTLGQVVAHRMRRPPEGTVLCDSVEVLE